MSGGGRILARLRRHQQTRRHAYLGGSFEAGGIWDWDDVDSRAVILGASAFAAIRSPIGPIYLAYG